MVRVAVAYLRVSSRSQSVDMQRDAIARAAEGRGDIISCWYTEQSSGRKLERPELDRVRARVGRSEVTRLYVWRLDRLTRSGIRDTLTVVDELRRVGCELVTVADGFDLDGPAAPVVLAVLAWAASMEREAIGSRIREARARVEAKGGSWGKRPRLGPAELAQVYRLRDEGRTVRDIAVALKVPRSIVGRAITDRPTADAESP